MHASTHSARQAAIPGPSKVECELQRVRDAMVDAAATRDSESKIALDLLAEAALLRREEQQRIRSCITLELGSTTRHPLEEQVQKFCQSICRVVEGQALESGMIGAANCEAKHSREAEEKLLTSAGIELLTQHQRDAPLDLGLWLAALVQTLETKDAVLTVSQKPRCLEMVKGLLDCIPGKGQDQELEAATATGGPGLRRSLNNAVANGGVAHTKESRRRLLRGVSQLASGGATTEVAMRRNITQKNRDTDQRTQSKDLVLPLNSHRPPAVPYGSLRIVRLKDRGPDVAPPPPTPLSRFQFGVRSTREMLPLPSLGLPPAAGSFPTAWGLAMVGSHGAIPNADPMVPGLHAKPGNLDFLARYS